MRTSLLKGGLVSLGMSHLLSTALAKCPNDCSQHGLCSGPGADAFCICEPGYGNEDCSVRFCPKADDPETENQTYREVLLSTGATSGYLSGHFDLTFMGQSIGFDADAGIMNLATALQNLPSVSHVVVSKTGSNEFGGGEFVLTFQEWPKGRPTDNNLYSHSGFPPLNFFKCEAESVTGASGVYCLVQNHGELDATKVIEYAECANHGG
eukprot:CAMPEP_0172619454 /NCGR_PEP_ID=MMETSP1068-20121228/93544_1 /TAXON_ID=35684 /ORGANISM="Pseudopedinella elastica, Strain CCMP716" /LENGTH=208 /DNA_ID=CAMNT_0013426215 /DNA_START=154 /DNA_END=777 /DNA_ORIENTATION=-